ncbi:hypothetical protein AVEN_15634-1 [Araneus ventricosus]|uniref:Uncharacterized protein n=1 Tax=Araneus ventricosus TaxID=182803 RepID=A0A4Y2LJQ3_ARAVE|nr:hypothetical protein AVEN_15634-1 [Araneus ventricosus]
MKNDDISNLKGIGKFSQFKASVKKFHEEVGEFLANFLYDDAVEAIWSWCSSFGEMMDDSRDFSFGEWAVVCGARWDGPSLSVGCIRTQGRREDCWLFPLSCRMTVILFTVHNVPQAFDDFLNSASSSYDTSLFRSFIVEDKECCKVLLRKEY